MLFKNVDLFLLFRFIACILVIRQHVNFQTPNYPLGFLLGGTPGSGGYAVVAFFLLSGYLLSKAFVSGRYTFSIGGILKYYFSRAKRILPLYYFVTLYTVFFVFPYIITPNQSQYLPYFWKLLTLNYYGGLPYFNQVYWTITVECLFYILLPLFGFFILRKKSYLRALVLFFVAIALLYYRFTFGVLNSVFADYLGVFVLGMVISLIPIKHLVLEVKYAQVLRYIGLCASVLSLMFPWDSFVVWLKISPANYLFATNLSVSLLISLFIIITEITGGSLLSHGKSWFSNAVNHLGSLSYAIYMSHILILSQFGSIFSESLLMEFSKLRAGYIIWFFVTVLSIIISNYLHFSVEIPGKKLFDKFESKITKFVELRLTKAK